MTKQEIYEAEQQNYGKIILHKEGVFWVAYERSAYLFHTNVRHFRISRRFIKTIQKEIISLGFPQAVLPSLRLDIVQKTETQITIATQPRETDFNTFIQNFNAWKSQATEAAPKQHQLQTHNSLPVYKAIYDLTLAFFRASPQIQKHHRYTLAEKIKNDLIHLTSLVHSAATTRNKEPYIKEARRVTEQIRVQMQLLRDLGQLTARTSAIINKGIESIAKQLALWHKTISGKILMKGE